MIIFAKLNNLKINNPKKMNEEITKKRKRTRSRRPRLPQGHFDALIDHPKPLGLSHEGRGISKTDDKTHFISYALPNETVKFEYQSSRSQFAEGRAIEIIKNPHPNRVKPKCDVFGTCGGCADAAFKTLRTSEL